MRRKLIPFMALLAVVAVGLAACGDDDDSGDATSLTVEASSFKYTPNSWSVAADTPITINFSNASDVDEHEFAVLTEGTRINSEAEFDEDLVLWEIEALTPGSSTSVTHTFAPGTYQVICALEGHFDSGMTGTLTVGGG